MWLKASSEGRDGWRRCWASLLPPAPSEFAMENRAFHLLLLLRRSVTAAAAWRRRRGAAQLGRGGGGLRGGAGSADGAGGGRPGPDGAGVTGGGAQVRLVATNATNATRPDG